MKFDKIAIVVPHPDDEILGCGGVIAKYSALGSEINLLVVSGHLPPLYPEGVFEETQNEMFRALDQVGIEKKSVDFCKIPGTQVCDLPVAQRNGLIQDFVDRVKPSTVFIPFPDRHIDHRYIFEASLVACRPNGRNQVRHVLCYETLSETHWNAPDIEPNFEPNVFVDISEHIDAKTQALEAYGSQVAGNRARGVNAVRALAQFRGSQNDCDFAEGFKLVRSIYN